MEFLKVGVFVELVINQLSYWNIHTLAFSLYLIKRSNAVNPNPTTDKTVVKDNSGSHDLYSRDLSFLDYTPFLYFRFVSSP